MHGFWKLDVRTLMLCALLGLIGGGASPALGQDAEGDGQRPADESPQAEQRPVDDATDATESRQVELVVGRSTVIRPPWPVSQVSVADPEIADVQVVSPGQVLVVGHAPGATDIFMWSEDEEVWQGRVEVAVDVPQLREDLGRFFVGSELEIVQRNNVVVIDGLLRRIEDAERLREYMEAAELAYVDMTSVAGVQQVQIQVRVAEASRSAIRALGINAVHGGSDFFGGSTIGGNPNNIDLGIPEGAPAAGNFPFEANAATAINPSVTLFGGFPDADLQLFLEALVENQYMRVLAEPTLVALSGEEANFLVGGEFPIPVVQSSGTGGGTSISVEFKEFGVRLQFEPTVLGDGSIRLHVAPEVSDISDVGAVVIDAFRIPSIITRRAETTLEMGSGQTFALAGLIDRTTTARSSRVPGIGELPIIGALFRSTRYEEGETELIVLATVSLVEPSSNVAQRPLPGMLHRSPSDWELFADGKIESEREPLLAPADQRWLRETGLDRLRGPGAWQSHGQPRALPRSRQPAREPRPETQPEPPSPQGNIQRELEFEAQPEAPAEPLGGQSSLPEAGTPRLPAPHVLGASDYAGPEPENAR